MDLGSDSHVGRDVFMHVYPDNAQCSRGLPRGRVCTEAVTTVNFYQTVTGFVPGHTYRLSLWASYYSTGGTRDNMPLTTVFAGNLEQKIGGTDPNQDFNGPVELIFQAEATSMKLGIHATEFPGWNKATSVDDFQLVDLGVPSLPAPQLPTLVLVGVGAIAVGAVCVMRRQA